MQKFFDVLFLSEAIGFLESLDKKHAKKILYNIRKAQVEKDADLFKKLSGIFGNFERFFRVINIACLLFGIKLIIKTR